MGPCFIHCCNLQKFHRIYHMNDPQKTVGTDREQANEEKKAVREMTQAPGKWFSLSGISSRMTVKLD